MQVLSKSQVWPFTSDHGETVWELVGGANRDVKHSVAYVEIAPGKASRKHYHPVVEESYYILEGEAEMTIASDTQTLKPGDCVLIPPTQPHLIVNAQNQVLKFLVVCAPQWTIDCSVFED